MSYNNVELARIGQLVVELYEAVTRSGFKGNPRVEPERSPPDSDLENDAFAFITAPAERETLRITAEHPNWTAAQVAAAVRQRLNNATTDKGVRFYWKIARLNARKRALLPPERLTQGHAADLSRFHDDDEE